MKINRHKIRTWHILSITTVLIAAFAVILGAIKKINSEVNAATPSGATVNITPGQEISYGEWITNRFTITSGAENFVGVCADPQKATPSGPTSAVLIDSGDTKIRRIKLMLYILTAKTPETEGTLNNIFQTISDENTRYGYIHGVIGYLNSEDTTGLDAEQVQWVRNVISTALDPNINNGTQLWKEADRYQLYVTGNGATDYQTIMWIEKKDPPARGDLKFTKTDNNGKPMANVLFTLTSLNANGQAKEMHVLVSDEKGVVNTASSFAKHSNNTNGYDSDYNDPAKRDKITFKGYGTWFSLDDAGYSFSVDDNSGALIQGQYVIQEISCPSNNFCYEIEGEKQSFVVSTNGQVVDLGVWDNDCADFSLKTTATDEQDGDHYIETGPEATIKDHVEYCVREDLTYTIKGVLMDKETGEPLNIDGQTFEQTAKITPTEKCGTIDMLFSIDASKLGGKDVVVYETLSYEGEIIESHEDLEDKDQTITIIELHTLATDNATGEKTVPANQEVKIKDVITYCLRPGQEYTIRGALMNKSTKEPVMYNGTPVSSEVTFTPAQKCGQAEIYYQLNTSNLAGQELVSFEKIYLAEEDKEGVKTQTLILAHEDYEDSGETIVVGMPEIVTPETGRPASAASGSTDSNPVNPTLIGGAVIICVVPYLASRIIRRRKILK